MGGGGIVITECVWLGAAKIFMILIFKTTLAYSYLRRKLHRLCGLESTPLTHSSGQKQQKIGNRFNAQMQHFSSDCFFLITRVSEVIMFSPCVFVCLSRCLSGRFNYEGLVPHKQYFAGTLLGMSSCASYVSRTHDVIGDVTRSQSRSNFESDISPSIFELERWSKAQNVGNAHGYLSGLFNFRYNFR